ncbi:13048_t:CDS:1, partial [Cetraspora pellucida]
IETGNLSELRETGTNNESKRSPSDFTHGRLGCEKTVEKNSA